MNAPTRGHAAVFALASALAACSPLTPLAAGVCGDGVVNPGEDCDGFVDAAAHEGCGAPDAGALACRFECAGTSECPEGYNCGVDLICRQPNGAFAPYGAPLPVGALTVTMADFNGDGFADVLSMGPPNDVGGVRTEVTFLNGDTSVKGTFSVADRLSSPSVADVNGDGLPDIVSAVRIAEVSGVSVFLGESAPTLAIQSFPTTIVPAAALPTSGATARALLITGFPSTPHVVYFAGTSSGAYPSGLYLPAGTGNPDLASPPSPSGDGSYTDFLPLPEGPDQVVGAIDNVQVLTGDALAQRPCKSLVYETVSGTVRVVSPCVAHPDGSVVFSSASSTTAPKTPFLSTVTLPSASATGCTSANECRGGVSVADVDGDGLPDLVITATSYGGASTPYATYVAYGDGLGGFSSAPPSSGQSTQGATGPAFTIALQAADGTVVPSEQIGETLAAGDLNGDGIADFVSAVAPYSTATKGPLAAGVTLLISNRATTANGNASVVYSTPQGALAWRSAAMGDFNGDGQVDVIGGGLTTTDLEFFEGSSLADGPFVAHAFVVATTGTVDGFAVADYDGDGVSDLAFDQPDPSNDGSVDVDIVYGNASGPPTAPVLVGRYADVAQIAGVEPYTELELVSTPLGAPSSVLTVSRFRTAAGGRPPLSSAALSSPSSGAPEDVAIRAVAGFFGSVPGASADAGGPLGIAALGQSGTGGGDSVWFLPAALPLVDGGVAFGSLTSTPTPTNVEPAPLASQTTNNAVLLGAGALVPGSVASLVAVASTGTNGGESALLVGQASDGGFAASNLTGGVAPTLPASAGDGGTRLSAAIAPDGQMGVADVDGDGFPDLVLLTGTDPGVDGFCGLIANDDWARTLVVYFGDGMGGFSIGAPTLVASCGYDCGAGADTDCPSAFVTLPAAGGVDTTLAFVMTSSGVHFANFPGSGANARVPVLTLPTTALTTPEGGTAADATSIGLAPGSGARYTGIGAGDVNGDGVTDLAVTVSGSVYFLVGAAKNP